VPSGRLTACRSEGGENGEKGGERAGGGGRGVDTLRRRTFLSLFVRGGGGGLSRGGRGIFRNANRCPRKQGKISVSWGVAVREGATKRATMLSQENPDHIPGERWVWGNAQSLHTASIKNFPDSRKGPQPCKGPFEAVVIKERDTSYGKRRGGCARTHIGLLVQKGEKRKSGIVRDGPSLGIKEGKNPKKPDFKRKTKRSKPYGMRYVKTGGMGTSRFSLTNRGPENI